MPTQILIDHIDSHRSRSHSPDGSEDGSQGTGVQLSPHSVVGSAPYSRSGSEHSGSHASSARSYVHIEPLQYPDELQSHTDDSASARIPRTSRHHTRHVADLAPQRSSSYHREPQPRQRAIHDREEAEYRSRSHYPGAPPSVDESIEDIYGHHARPGPPAQRHSLTPGWGYAPSTTEPYQYPQVPQVPSNQMLQSTGGYGPYGHDPYGQRHPSYHHQGYHPHQPGAVGHPYAQHFSPPAPIGYPPSSASYFPQYPPSMAPFAMPQPVYQTHIIEAPARRSVSPVKHETPPAAPPPKDTSEETVKLMKELFEKQQKQIEDRDAAREAERKAIEDAKKAAEERAAADKKLQEAATAAAKEEAAKELAAAKEKADKALKDAQEASEKALKEAKEAAEKETAEKVAAAKAAPPAEKKDPIKFKDAIGRKYQFPWDMCCKWTNMEELIRQAFTHVEGMAQHVYDGHYDLAGPSGEIILKDCWEATIEPGWTIVMHMWPLPEEKSPEEELVAGMADILILEEKKKAKKAAAKKGAKIISVPEKKKGTSKGHGPIPVPPPVPEFHDHMFGEIPILDVPGPDSKSKKGAKRPQSGIGSWMFGARPGPSKPKKK